MNPFLHGLTPLYAGAIALRNAAYDAGFFKTHSIPVPVISIGNITAGGSGKTPIVAYTASLLMQEQYRTAIVSRGYKRTSTGTVLVSDGNAPLVDAAQGGDEPVMLAQHAQGAVIISDEDRVRGCAVAVNEYESNAIVLDDAFQHRRCARNLDVVVYDVSTLPHEQGLLPAGRLREPMRNIARADFILLSRCNSLERAESVMNELSRYTSAPHATTRFRPAHIRNTGTNDVISLDDFRSYRSYAFCGIGMPDSFRATLQEAGATVAGFRAFPDHHRYSDDELQALITAARQAGARCLVTTEKDAVRLVGRQSKDESLPIYSIVMGIEFLRGETAYGEALLHTVRSR